ncbi:MAG TPA: efflux RND transporter periplasmic adaptor subunit [Gammaproteobacteria bacterium]|nr:efflux RND transporter periplasmic adaptor subunit [Gammaproteobacteria bacterium]
MSPLSPAVFFSYTRFIHLLLFLLLASVIISARAQAGTDALELLPVQYHKVVEERTLDAVIEAVNKATVSAQTSGRVTKIYFDVDDVVHKGDVLLRLRDRDQRARFNAARARHVEAEAEYRRVKEIHAKKLVARSLLDKAEARLKSARAAMDQAQESLENTIVRAPYSGIVVKRYIEVGETARVGQPLFTGLSLESLRATVNLPQDLINVVRKLKRARVISDSDFAQAQSQSIIAKSMIISPYADPVSHTFLLRVNLPPGQHGMYPGMAVKVAFVTREVKKLLVPIAAVAHRSEVSAVYVVDKDGRLSMRQVRLGSRVNAEQVEILAGLQEGEQIARDPLAATVHLKEQNARLASNFAS